METTDSANHKFVIHLVAAARPNFMKIAPLYQALKNTNMVNPVIIHTGQHYDGNMSDVFFQDLGLPKPHFHLNIGSGSHAEHTGNVMIAYEKILFDEKPDLVIVVGDVNSTMAATLAAVKLEIKVGHLEAGLRSFDRTMPEEINRLVTDSLADILWTPSADADENLLREGILPNKVHRVGNIMIDSLEILRQKIQNQSTYQEFGLNPVEYGLITLHRPLNVDNHEVLKAISKSLKRISLKIPLIFPVHPRTWKNLKRNGLMSILTNAKQLFLVEPMSYVRFMNLLFNCRLVITDSGGLQEETTYLGIPCLTLRPNTERPITILQGTNQLCKVRDIEEKVRNLLTERSPKYSIPELWDGKTANRVVKSIFQKLTSS